MATPQQQLQADIIAAINNSITGGITGPKLQAVLLEMVNFSATQTGSGGGSSYTPPPALAAVLHVAELTNPGTINALNNKVPAEPENDIFLWWNKYPFVTPGGILDNFMQAQLPALNWANIYSIAGALNP